MNNISLISLIIGLAIGLAVGVIVASGIFLPALKKKGAGSVLEQASNTIGVINKTFDSLKTIMPDNPAVNMIDKILDWAYIGVEQAEQLYLIGRIKGDERKAAAIDFIRESLNLAGIEITPSIEKIIDGAVEASVLALGHKK